MIYTIKYQREAGVVGSTIVRHLCEQRAGSRWQLKDGNFRNIRPFNTLEEAMTWVDEERREFEVAA